MIALVAAALGGFYFVGGVVLLRALALSQFMDMALAALEGRGQTRAVIRAILLGLGGVLTSLSGLALIMLHASALPLMLANVALQILWLLVALRWFPPEDEDDRRGRLSTLRATAYFVGATLLMLWLERKGHLVFASTDLSSAVLTLAAVGLLGWQTYTVIRLSWSSRRAEVTAGEADEVITEYLPARLHLEPRFFTQALWDADSGQSLDPDHVTMAPDLRQRITDFGLTTGRAFDADQPGGSRIADPATRAVLEAEARAIVMQLVPLVGEENVSWYLPADDAEWCSLTI